MEKRTPDRMVEDYSAISVYQYNNGTVELHHVRMDNATKRMVSELLATVVQPPEEPFTLSELLIMAALESAVRRGRLIGPLSW